MDFDPSLLILSILPSAVGFVLFTYGRKQQRWPQFAVGMLLMVYPYFTGSIASMTAAGMLLGAALYVMLAMGY